MLFFLSCPQGLHTKTFPSVPVKQHWGYWEGNTLKGLLKVKAKISLYIVICFVNVTDVFLWLQEISSHIRI